MWLELILSILWMACFVLLCMRFKGEVLRTVFLSVVMTAGYCFVSHVICGRDNPFLSEKGSVVPLLELLLFAEGFALLCCRETLSTLTKIKGLFHQEVFWYLVCFFPGLCIGYLFRIREITFTLSPESLPDLNLRMVLLLALGVVAAVTLLTLSTLEAWKKEEFKWYFPLLISLPALFVLISWLIREDFSPTVHRWQWSLFLIVFLRYPVRISRLPQAFALGVFVNALATSGLERIWYPV